jgi:putative inorganic carbon (hco3(-)) transporter
VRRRLARLPLLPVALIAGGAGYFASQVPGLSGLRTPALVAACVVALVHLVRNAEPAWLISLGIAASMFSGHWIDLGIQDKLVPDRILITAGVLAVALRLGRSRDRPRLELRPVHFLLAAALAYAVISSVLAQTFGDHEATFALIDQFGALPFIVYAVAPVAFRTAHQRKILLGTLVATGAYLSLTALFEKLNLHALIFPRYIDDPTVGIHFGRSRGPFAEAVANGLALYACAVASAIAAATWRQAWQRTAAVAVTVLSLVGVLLTVTRAVWLGAAVSTILILIAAPQLRRFAVPALATGLVVVLGAFAVIPGLADQAREREKDKSPVWERKNSNSAALRMIADRPLVGFGWYRHNENSEPYFRLNPGYPLSGERAGLHNVFLIYAVGLGLVGFGLWLAAGALAFGRAIRGRAPPGIEPWRIGLGAIGACYITAGVAGPLAYVFPTLLLWTWAGVASQRDGDMLAPSASIRDDGLERVPGESP